MTPKRFKAVCTETGREFGVYEINRHIISLPSHNAQWFSWDQITIYEDIEDFTSKYNPELCQSTGLTDSRGQEVYEGDVLACECHMDIAVVWVEKSPTGEPIAAWGWKYFHPDFDHVQYHNTFLLLILSAHQNSGLCKKRVVIGNRWQPAEELKARAEAVSESEPLTEENSRDIGELKWKELEALHDA